MKKSRLKFFAAMLTLIFILTNLSFNLYASEATEKDLAPYIAMFEQYAEETELDVYIDNIDSFYEACKHLSLSEWKERLDEIFEEFKLISENNEPFVFERDNNMQFRVYDSAFDGGVPGISSGSDDGVPGLSSSGSYNSDIKISPENNIISITPFALFSFYDIFQGYINSDYRYRMTVDGTIVSQAGTNVFNTVYWQSYTFSGQKHFRVTYFRNTVNNGTSASTEAVGVYVTEEGIALGVQVTMYYTIYASWYNG